MSISYLVIGEAMLDKVGDSFVTGGQASFSSLTAKSLGCDTSVLTAVADDFDPIKRLPGIDVTVVPSKETTVHENIHIHKDGKDSRLWLQSSQSDTIKVSDLPERLRKADIVQFGVNTRVGVDFKLMDEFDKTKQIVGLAPQGIYRTVGDDGKIVLERYEKEEELMSKATAVFLGESDMIDDTMLDDAIKWSETLVVTRGSKGCDVFVRGEKTEVPVKLQDPIYETGAGDIFVAAFLVEYHKSKRDPIRAAKFANLVASHSILETEIDDRINRWRKV